jgi:adenosine kinase
MLKNKSLKIAVSGSLAYDQIMNFPGCFGDHILPDQIHNLNVSFFLGGLKTSFGGTAGNIAYNLSLLGVKPTIFGVVGGDFSSYETWLKKRKIDLSRVKKMTGEKTAAAYIITDRKDNQITAFYPGPLPKNYVRPLVAGFKNIAWAIIAPDDKARMLDYAAMYQQKKIPYIFDPGQALIAFSSAELKKALSGAQILIGNDYEIKLTQNKLGIDLKTLIKTVEILVITKGGEGSEIYQRGDKVKKIIVPAARPKNTCDPTGAGDAYRAGFIKGLLSGGDLKTCGRLAGLVAVYTVEKFGTQTHSFTLAGLKKRYYENYGERLTVLKEKAPDADGTAQGSFS